MKMSVSPRIVYSNLGKLRYLELIRNIKRDIRRGQKTVAKEGKSDKKYSHTILLPTTTFPLRISPTKRVESDETIYEACKFSDLYDWQRQNVKGNQFILHDGPPYANGNLHMGHAINKILKDITIRHKLLQGYRIHYVPGWDCHGLPIELKAIKNYNKQSDSINIRQKARNIAEEAIKCQKRVFQSWGVMANWNKCYSSFNKEYIEQLLHQFYNLYKKGLIYADVKPVYWSPSSRTALAEAELVYNNQHVSKSILVRLSVNKLPDSVKSELVEDTVKALIWTTTPWTLPMNQFICYNPDLTYCIVSSADGDLYLLALDSVEKIRDMLGTELQVQKTFPGNLLREAQYCHPVNSEKLPFLSGLHVTSEKGSGLVHSAPAHGPDDFLVALKHGIPVINMVDDDGCYTSEVGSCLVGMNVLKEGNEQVINLLRPLILHVEDYVHSYPCDWRTNEPVILKASKQWFIDTKTIKEKALKELHGVNVYPKKFECHSTLISQLEKRPYWCISRQRVWGVPIPVLYRKDDEQPIISRKLISHYIDLLHTHGSDFWWSLPKEMIAPDHLLKDRNLTTSSIDIGKDILDIWYDSGLSWFCVLGNENIADLYLEGMDQYTGWFQSSLMTSVAVRGKSPFRSLFVHGFAVDEKGHKMSKSVGNVIDPEEITRGRRNDKKHPALGVDTLRWWVASHASQYASVPVSFSIMEESASEIQKIRLVFRFLLGSLCNFEDNLENLNNAYLFDLWMLHVLRVFENEMLEAYNEYQYNRACKILLNFVTNEVSSAYLHSVKDRLYCLSKNDRRRLSCQHVLKNLLEVIARAAAPIVPFLAEEVHLHHPCKREEHIFYSSAKPKSERWNFPEAVDAVNTAFAVKKLLNKLYLGNSKGLHIQIYATGKDLLNLKKFSENEEINEIIQISSSKFVEGSDSELSVKFEPSIQKVCPRCRQHCSLIEDALCSRCKEVIKEIKV